MRLRPVSLAQTTDRLVISSQEPVNAVMADLAPQLSEERGDELLQVAKIIPRRQVPFPLFPLRPEADSYAAGKNRSWIACTILVIGLAGSLAIWWTVGRTGQRAVSSTVTTATTSSPITVPTNVATAAPGVGPLAVVGSDEKKVQESRATTKREEIRRAAALKRKVKRRLTSVSKVVGSASVKKQRPINDAALKQYQDESSRAARLKITQQTPQQVCADRSNFISRGICEARECEKPERVSLKFCIDMLARRAPRDYPN